MAEDDTCAVHGIKCKEWTKTEAKVDDLQKSKLSIAMTRIIISVIALCGVVFFYRVESRQSEEALSRAKEILVVMGHVERTNDKLSDHLILSNTILRNMSKDMREIKLNQIAVMKKIDIEYTKIPSYYGPDD